VLERLLVLGAQRRLQARHGLVVPGAQRLQLAAVPLLHLTARLVEQGVESRALRLVLLAHGLGGPAVLRVCDALLEVGQHDLDAASLVAHGVGDALIGHGVRPRHVLGALLLQPRRRRLALLARALQLASQPLQVAREALQIGRAHV
jgi:predicted alpha/beta hydrolase family esterase